MFRFLKTLRNGFITIFPTKNDSFFGLTTNILKNQDDYVIDNYISIFLTNSGSIHFNNELSVISQTSDRFRMKITWHDVTRGHFLKFSYKILLNFLRCRIDVG